MELNQFDTIYHEHFSYFSFLTVQKVLVKHGLTIFDVEELPTHGGSLRIYCGHETDQKKADSPRIRVIIDKERSYGLDQLETFHKFSTKPLEVKQELLRFLMESKSKKSIVAAYGAPAKGNTLLNYCGVDTQLIEFAVDVSPHKQGRFMPGSR